MDELWTVAAGAVVGIVIIAVLNAFPGQPFDYDQNAIPTQASSHGESCRAGADDQRKARTREVEIAASQLKVHKLQELLGLERHEVQKMIDQAKADAIRGRQPGASSTNYARRLDWAFYAVITAAMVVVLRTEYTVDVVQILASVFPREAETVRKVAALVPSHLVAHWT